MAEENVSGQESRFRGGQNGEMNGSYSDDPTQNSNSIEGKQNGHSDEESKAEKGDEGPPTPVGFFDHSLHAVRKEVFWKWGLTTLVLMLFILGVLSICMSFIGDCETASADSNTRLGKFVSC